MRIIFCTGPFVRMLRRRAHEQDKEFFSERYDFYRRSAADQYFALDMQNSIHSYTG